MCLKFTGVASMRGAVMAGRGGAVTSATRAHVGSE